MLFAGQYEVKLERKKRILLPKIFLKSLEKQSFKGIFLFPSLDGKNIEACGEAWLAYWSRKMDEQGSLLNKNEILLSNILDHMVPSEADKSGRINLPLEWIKKYEMQTPLMLTGRGFRFQIWRKEDFISYRANMQTRLSEVYKAQPLKKADIKDDESRMEEEYEEEYSEEAELENIKKQQAAKTIASSFGKKKRRNRK